MELAGQDRRDRDPAAAAGPRPWWAADSPRPQFPMGTLFLAGRTGSRWSGLLTIAVLLLLVLTRALVFPESIWDQDEAYLCHAVIDFDPVDNQPHPPWFPAWVAAGRLVAPLFAAPADGLRVLSALSSVWMVFPLTALFGIWMRRELALGSALLYLCLPGPWYLSGRAFSDTPATFLLVLTAAWWLRPYPSRTDLLCGSLAGGLCLLVRPQLALPVFGLLHVDIVDHDNASKVPEAECLGHTPQGMTYITSSLSRNAHPSSRLYPGKVIPWKYRTEYRTEVLTNCH